MGVGVRVISGERTGYAYSDDLSPEKIRKAARVAACIAAGPSKVDKFDLNEGARHNLYPVLTAPTETAFAERVELVKRADRAARAYDSAHLPGAGRLCRQPPPRDGGHQRRRPHASTASRWRASASPPWRGENGGPPQRGHAGGGGRVELDFFLKERPPEHFAAGGRARSHRHARFGGSAGRRNDRGARSRLARHPAARSRGPRPRGRFQPQGRFRLQRPHRPEGGQRAVHGD